MDPKTFASLFCVFSCLGWVLAIFITPFLAIWLDRTGRLTTFLKRMERKPKLEEVDD